MNPQWNYSFEIPLTDENKNIEFTVCRLEKDHEEILGQRNFEIKELIPYN